jgi:hypothetical protein
MIRAIPGNRLGSTKALIQQVMDSGQMDQQQHLQLTSAILAGRHVNDEDRRQINRIFDCIQTGRIKLIEKV